MSSIDNLNLVWDDTAPTVRAQVSSTVAANTLDDYLKFLDELGSLRNPSKEPDNFPSMFSLE